MNPLSFTCDYSEGAHPLILDRLVRTNLQQEAGYGYAIIGWMDDAVKFYEACLKGFRIPDSDPKKTIYSTLTALAGKQ